VTSWGTTWGRRGRKIRESWKSGPYLVRSMRAPYPYPFSFPLGSWVLFAWALLAWAQPCSGQDSGFTVFGRVVEVTNATWIGGATVTLSGRPPFISDQNGQFRLEDVPAGPYTLSVQAMGYRSQDVSLTIRADTELLIEMEVDPIRLDSLLVEAGFINVRGNVVDAATGARIPEARIRAGRAPETFSSSRGLFRVKDLPRGYSIPILVDAFKYLPVRIALITDQDTTLTIPMEADLVSIRFFQETVQELEIRSRGVALSRTQLNRRYIQLLPNRSVYGLIKWRLRRDFNSDCIFVDEVKYPSTSSPPTPPWSSSDEDPPQQLRN
jgi:hypothetical protein